MKNFVWAFAFITAWSSAVISAWLMVFVDGRLIYFSFFWFVVSIIIAIIPSSVKTKK